MKGKKREKTGRKLLVICKTEKSLGKLKELYRKKANYIKGQMTRNKMANKHVKHCLTLLEIKEIQIRETSKDIKVINTQLWKMWGNAIPIIH